MDAKQIDWELDATRDPCYVRGGTEEKRGTVAECQEFLLERLEALEDQLGHGDAQQATPPPNPDSKAKRGKRRKGRP